MKLGSYMSERDLGDAAMAAQIGGCSASAVRKWRYGHRVPRAPVIIRIRQITGGLVTANDFIFGDSCLRGATEKRAKKTHPRSAGVSTPSPLAGRSLGRTARKRLP